VSILCVLLPINNLDTATPINNTFGMVNLFSGILGVVCVVLVLLGVWQFPFIALYTNIGAVGRNVLVHW